MLSAHKPIVLGVFQVKKTALAQQELVFSISELKEITPWLVALLPSRMIEVLLRFKSIAQKVPGSLAVSRSFVDLEASGINQSQIRKSMCSSLIQIVFSRPVAAILTSCKPQNCKRVLIRKQNMIALDNIVIFAARTFGIV